jgi:hypothetical protein
MPHMPSSIVLAKPSLPGNIRYQRKKQRQGGPFLYIRSSKALMVKIENYSWDAPATRKYEIVKIHSYHYCDKSPTLHTA